MDENTTCASNSFFISICQLFSSFYSYLRDDVYYTTKFGVHSLYWLVMSWEEFTLTVFISIDNVQQSRMGMIGDWFFLATACMLFLMAFNKDVLEVLQNAAFILLTISTIRQIPIRGAYVFFGVFCSLYMAISLYTTFASLINSIGEKALIPVGAQVMSSSMLQNVLMSVKSYLMKSKNIPGATICEVPDALFYICNGLAALSAIQGTLNDPIRQHLSIPSVLIPGAIFQLYVCRIQVRSSILLCCYLGNMDLAPVCRGHHTLIQITISPCSGVALYLLTTKFAGAISGHLLNIDAASDGGFTAGSVAFLVVNVFLMVIASYSNLVLLCLTFVMEVLIICFLLFTVEHLPVPLEIVMLSIFGAICIYGATASLANYIFGKDLIMMGPPLFRVEMTKEDTLFKVLFNFPLRYLLTIGLVPVFSLRWSLPPALGCIPKQPDSKKTRSRRAGGRYRPHTVHGLCLDQKA